MMLFRIPQNDMSCTSIGEIPENSVMSGDIDMHNDKNGKFWRNEVKMFELILVWLYNFTNIIFNLMYP